LLQVRPLRAGVPRSRLDVFILTGPDELAVHIVPIDSFLVMKSLDFVGHGDAPVKAVEFHVDRRDSLFSPYQFFNPPRVAFHFAARQLGSNSFPEFRFAGEDFLGLRIENGTTILDENTPTESAPIVGLMAMSSLSSMLADAMPAQ
jgi:hypothetical protein